MCSISACELAGGRNCIRSYQVIDSRAESNKKLRVVWTAAFEFGQNFKRRETTFLVVFMKVYVGALSGESRD